MFSSVLHIVFSPPACIHLARLAYRMLRRGEKYVEKGIEHYEQRYQLQRMKWLKKEAHSLNLQLFAVQ